jgi:hypothetical protein
MIAASNITSPKDGQQYLKGEKTKSRKNKALSIRQQRASLLAPRVCPMVKAAGP